jgi:hypothetical protein
MGVEVKDCINTIIFFSLTSIVMLSLGIYAVICNLPFHSLCIGVGFGFHFNGLITMIEHYKNIKNNKPQPHI